MRVKVLVDTSVFIDFLRGNGSENLAVLIADNQVVLSKVVRLEILAGLSSTQARIFEKLLTSLDELHDFPKAADCERLLMRLKGRGLIGGFADLLILADSIRSAIPLYTLDQKMRALAKELKIPQMIL